MAPAVQRKSLCACCGDDITGKIAFDGPAGRECESCHAFLAEARKPASPPPTVSRPPRQLCCPKCGSDQIRKVSVIYESGTSGIAMTGQASTFGVAFDEGGAVPAFGLTDGAVQGTQQTLLAQKLQPPQEPTETHYTALALGATGITLVSLVIGWFAVEWHMASFFGAVIVVILALGIGAFFWGLKHDRQIQFYVSEIWPREMYAWSRSWYCMKCGNIAEEEKLSAQSGPRGTSKGIAEELAGIHHLYQEGALTEEEWTRAKESFLGAPADETEKTAKTLRNLFELASQGVLSESEFRMKKWDLLARTRK